MYDQLPSTINGVTNQFTFNHNFGASAWDTYWMKGYQRDESYAFYISWVMKDGTESVAYHIPGRPAGGKNPWHLYDNGKNTVLWEDGSGTALFEDDFIDANTTDTAGNPHAFAAEAAFIPNVKFYQIDNGIYFSNIANHNMMLFWENINEFYPDTDDFDIWTCNPAGQPTPLAVKGQTNLSTGVLDAGWRWNNGVNDATLRLDNVRHHHFPSEMSQPATMFTIAEGVAQGMDSPRFNPMGFKLKGIPIPGPDVTYAPGQPLDQYYQGEGIRHKVIGYKIWYAKRGEDNMTVIDSGMLQGASRTLGAYAEAPRGVMWYPTVNQSTWSSAWDTSVNQPYFSSSVTDAPEGRAQHDPNYKTNDDSTFATRMPLDMLVNKRTIQAATLFKGTAWCGPYSPTAGQSSKGGYHGVVRYDLTNLQEKMVNLKESHMLFDLAVDRSVLKNGNFSNITISGFNYSLNYFSSSLIEDNSYKSIKAKTYVPPSVLFSSVGGFTYGIDNTGGTETFAFEFNNQASFAKWHSVQAEREPSACGGGYGTISDQAGMGHFYMYHGCTTSGFQNWYGYLNDYVRPGGSCCDGNTNHMGNGTCKFLPGVFCNLPDASTGDYTIQDCFYSHRYMATYGTLNAILSDVYNSFLQQIELVYTGSAGTVAPIPTATDHRVNSDVIFGGDTYLGYYAYNQYRKATTINVNAGVTGMSAHWDHPLNTDDGGSYGLWPDPAANTACNGSTRDGGKNNTYDYTTHIIITESRMNPYLRHAPLGADAFYPEYAANANEITDHEDPYISQGAYNVDYNAQNDFKRMLVADGSNLLQKIEDFPTRIVRSVKFNRSGINDNFRLYLAEQYRDLPRNRGELWSLQSYNNILVPHLERALTLTKGKETLKLSDVSEAFLGTGDLFENDPSEVLNTDIGYAGTQSQWAGIVSQFGYFFIDAQDNRVFLLGEKLEEISMYGMRNWFRENCEILTFQGVRFDMPTHGIGFTSAYDPELKRFILTKRNRKGTEGFNANANHLEWDPDASLFTVMVGFTLSGDCGICNWTPGDTFGLGQVEFFYDDNWTISYYPDRQAWVSFHSYTPHWYISGLQTFYSAVNQPYTSLGTGAVWPHTNNINRGSFYNTVYDFEYDFVDNTSPIDTKLFASFSYTIETLALDTTGPTIDTGFNSYFVYNSIQFSQTHTIDGTSGTGNMRRTDRNWFCNDFRDDAAYPISGAAQFLESGMSIIPNASYLDMTKQWWERRKFIDKWVGIRLIGSNSQNKLVNLYSIDTSKRKTYR